MFKYYLCLFVLLSSIAEGQQAGLRWIMPNGIESGYTIKTKRAVFQLQLEAEGLDKDEQFTIRYFRNGLIYVPGNDKMGVVKLQKSQGSIISLSEEVSLLIGENSWEAEIKSVKGKVMRTEPLSIVRKTGKPNLYLLSVGVPYNLKYTRKDAQAIFTRFKTQEGHLFDKVEGQVLICDQNTRLSKLGQSLSDIKYQDLTEDDVLILFFSSHGLSSSASGIPDFGLVSNDAGFDVRDERYVLLFYQKDIIQNISKLPCKRIVFLDACHSGAARNDKSWVGTLEQAQSIISRTPSGIVTIASSSKDQLSWESPSWQHGAFTFAILEGLSGKADKAENKGNMDNTVTINELSSYLKARVPILVDSAFQQKQEPYLVKNPEVDYPIFNYKQKNKETIPNEEPCNVPVAVLKPVKIQMAVLGIYPDKSEMDWTLTNKTITALQTLFPAYLSVPGKESMVKDGTAVAILDGYPPPHRNLATELGTKYLCINTRQSTKYQKEGTKWEASVQMNFKFILTDTKAVINEIQFEETGKANDKQQAENIAIQFILKKLASKKIVL